MLNPGSLIEIRELTDAAQLEQLRAEWSRLLATSPSATPFQSPQWLLPWYHFLGRGGLRVLVVRSASQLVGLIPLESSPGSDGRLRLALLGDGISDYLGGVIARGFEPAVAEALSHYLRRTAGSCELHDLPSDSSLLSLPAPPGWSDRVCRHSFCPVLRADSASKPGQFTIPAEQRRKVSFYLRRAHRRARVEWSWAERESLDELIEGLFRLHGERWRAGGEPGVLSQAALQAFHRETARQLLQAGMLRLLALQLDSQLAAVLYSFELNRRTLLYLSGFDPVFKAISPGLLIIGHAIETAERAGLLEVDFLRGQEDYKYRWGATDRPTFQRILSPGSECGVEFACPGEAR
jgi:CelD/BcsL family acetyltransferase involved in cellulose biosynthesis